MRKGSKHSEESKKKMLGRSYGFAKGYTPWNKGGNMSEESRIKMSRSRKGISRPLEVVKKIADSQRGKKKNAKPENHWSWKGGVTPMNHLIRSSIEYRLWREAVFKRDNFTCQSCGAHGVKLNADHIKPFALFPELRMAIDNGQTLCVPCHRKTPTFGKRKIESIYLPNLHEQH